MLADDDRTPAGPADAPAADAPQAPPVDAVPQSPPSEPASGLIDPWKAFEDQLRSDYTKVFPPGEEVVSVGGDAKRLVKRILFRAIRPVVRRYDRLLADAAALGLRTTRSLADSQRELASLAERLGALAADLRAAHVALREHDVRIGQAATELDLLARRVGSAAKSEAATSTASTAGPTGGTTASSTPTAHEAVLPEAFYWRFESALRGTTESVTRKLGVYRAVADRLRERFDADPLWLDLGCGEGLFMEVLRTWGWRVRGMDVSAQAVDACRAKGLDATIGTLPDFLAEPLDEPPAAISLIQVIEHLPTSAWLPTVRYAERALVPGGQLVVETIDPRNPHGLQAFFADITHTWAAHPDTLKVIAGFAGFADAEILGINPDDTASPQDFALIATKAPA